MYCSLSDQLMTRPNGQITDAVSIHSLKKIQYAKRLAAGNFSNVSLLDHFVSVRLFLTLSFNPHLPRRQTFGDPSSAKFARAQRNFAKSLAGSANPVPIFIYLLTSYLGYSVLTYLLQIKDRHNGNLLIDREGHLIHIDWGFILESSPGGNFGFEAAPFKLPLEYIEVLGGLDSEPWKEFKSLVREGFESVRKHCDSIVSEYRFLRFLSMKSSY